MSLHRQRQVAIALALTIVIPILVAIVRMLLGPKYFPTIDWAITELRVRDVFHEFVTVGPYSRYGWNHPGPLLFVLLAIPYKLSGGTSISMHITAAVVNIGCVLGSCALGWRRMRLAGVIAVAVPLGLVVHAWGPNQIRDPWNPYLPMLPLFLFVMLMWSVAVGDLWLAVPGVVVASFIVQSHVGFAGVVGAITFGSLALMIVTRVRTRSRSSDESSDGDVDRGPSLIRVTLASVFALVVCWFPVGYGTFVRHDGNLRRVADFFTTEHPTAGWSNALRVLGLQWGVQPEWIFGSRGASRLGVLVMEPRWWLALGLLVAGLGLAAGVRNHKPQIAALGVLVALALIAATVSASEIVGAIFPYLVRWTWVPGSFLGVVALLGLFSGGSDRILRVGAVAAVLGLVGLGIASTVAATDADVPDVGRQAGERSVSRQVLRALPPGHGPVLIDGSRAFFAVPGLALQIERRGIPVMITPGQSVVYGDRRLPRGSRFRAVLAVAEGKAARGDGIVGRRIATYRRRDASGRLVDDVAVFLVRRP